MSNISVDLDWADSKRDNPTVSDSRLMVAIVRRAVWDFVLYRDSAEGSEQKLIAEDAAAWLFWDGIDNGPEDPYSFLFICSVLGLDAARIRKHTLKMTRQDIQRLNNHIKRVIEE